MKILPVHLLKLRWLLSRTDLLKKIELDLVQNMQQSWSKVNYLVSCPLNLVVLDSIYEKANQRSLHVTN